jgi:DNA-binding transcriptional LysR family regulator
MRVTTLYRETFAVIVRRGHPCLAAPLTPAAYAGLAHILIAAPGDGPGLVDLALDEHGLRRNVVLRTPHFLTVAPFVAASDLICTVPSRIARDISDSLGVVVLDPPLPIHGFDVQMFWHPRRERDPAVQWLREQLRAVAATLGEPRA